jgi:hypothetical protein
MGTRVQSGGTRDNSFVSASWKDASAAVSSHHTSDGLQHHLQLEELFLSTFGVSDETRRRAGLDHIVCLFLFFVDIFDEVVQL